MRGGLSSQLWLGNVPQHFSEELLLAELDAYHIAPLKIRYRPRAQHGQDWASVAI